MVNENEDENTECDMWDIQCGIYSPWSGYPNKDTAAIYDNLFQQRSIGAGEEPDGTLRD